jgi:hypothetical protein
VTNVFRGHSEFFESLQQAGVVNRVTHFFAVLLLVALKCAFQGELNHVQFGVHLLLLVALVCCKLNGHCVAEGGMTRGEATSRLFELLTMRRTEHNFSEVAATAVLIKDSCA